MSDKPIMVICNRGGENGDCGVTDCFHRAGHLKHRSCGMECLMEANCVPVCSKCQKEPNDGWPDNTGNPEGLLCQMCWEAQCDDSWWEYWDAWNKEKLAEIT